MRIMEKDDIRNTIGVITADIIGSRRLEDQNVWILPLKALFNQWNLPSKAWSIYRGDSFQVTVAAEDVVLCAIQIKALIKSIRTEGRDKRSSEIDVKLALGIGAKGHEAEVITESNGEAYIHSGELFEKMKDKKRTLAIRTPWKSFDKEMNLYFWLALMAMDTWTLSSANLIKTMMEFPEATQEEIGQKLAIEQNSVSGRAKRAHVEEVMAVEKMFRYKINEILA